MTNAEIQERIDDLASRIRHQPAPRPYLQGPSIDTGCCTNPRCTCRGGKR